MKQIIVDSHIINRNYIMVDDDVPDYTIISLLNQEESIDSLLNELRMHVVDVLVEEFSKDGNLTLVDIEDDVEL